MVSRVTHMHIPHVTSHITPHVSRHTSHHMSRHTSHHMSRHTSRVTFKTCNITNTTANARHLQHISKLRFAAVMSHVVLFRRHRYSSITHRLRARSLASKGDDIVLAAVCPQHRRALVRLCNNGAEALAIGQPAAQVDAAREPARVMREEPWRRKWSCSWPPPPPSSCSSSSSRQR
jgi:hypothetical protein